MEQIGKRLRALREGIRLTQVQMAQISTDRPSNPVSTDFETGQSTPSPRGRSEIRGLTSMCRWIISIVAQTSHGASCMITSQSV